jgi:hypothetical protein
MVERLSGQQSVVGDRKGSNWQISWFILYVSILFISTIKIYLFVQQNE